MELKKTGKYYEVTFYDRFEDFIFYNKFKIGAIYFIIYFLISVLTFNRIIIIIGGVIMIILIFLLNFIGMRESFP